MVERPRRPAAFFDRDGVLNVDHGYVYSRANFKWIPGAIDAVKALNNAGYYVFVATNQSGIARGFYTEREMQALHDFMDGEFARAGARIDDWRHCPFHPDGTVARFKKSSDWRKPGPGMILDLMKMWPIDRGSSVLIGDKESDMEAARAAGIKPLWFHGGDLLTFVREFVLSGARSFR
jgi:D-glycero-D-manno-heptose 1,7-bisphosphate phosphatase